MNGSRLLRMIGGLLFASAVLQVYLDIRRTAFVARENIECPRLSSQLQTADNGSELKLQPLSLTTVTTNSQVLLDERPKKPISMEDYIKWFYLKKDVHVCTEIEQPNVNEFYLHKNVYHSFNFTPEGYNSTDAYLLSFYYDDRFLHTGARYIRTFISLRGIGPERQAAAELIKRTAVWSWAVNRTPLWALLWYEGFDKPLSVQCKIIPAFGMTRDVSGVFFYENVVTCPLPEIEQTPSFVSLGARACGIPTNYIRLTLPRLPRSPQAQDIGVCMASLFGVLNSTHVPYIVSWMEALSIFGVTEVTMNNAILSIDATVQRVFDYYQSQGRLIYTQFPVVHERWKESEQDQATESTNRMHVGHCFYQNIRRYWKTFVIDLDELPVPRSHATYQEVLVAIAAKNASLAHAHCLSMRSAFFYLDSEPGDPQYAETLPLLRQTLRLAPEPVQFGHNDGLGLAKSIHNPHRVVTMGHHLCRASHSNLGVERLKQAFLPESDLLIHHYRSACKYKPDCGDPSRLMRDATLPEKIGTQLAQRVQAVYTALGLNYDAGSFDGVDSKT